MSSLRKLKEKIENKNKKPRKAPVYNREDGPQCDVCLRRFANNQTLRNHRARVHEGKTSKDFECPKCHKKFIAKGVLKRHDETVHLKLRKYVCEVCGRAYGQNAHLQGHIRTKHSRTFVDDEDEDHVSEDVDEDEDEADEDEARSDDHGDDDADDSDSESSSLEELLRKRLASRNKRRR
jgi:uncharacterized Zn-finger protein